MKHLVVVALLAGCSSEPSGDRATIGSLEFSVPSGWTSRDYSTRQQAMFEWTPGDANDRKESLTVLRTDRPALGKATPRQLGRILEQAQRGLPRGTFSAPSAFVTRGGFHGLRIEGQFVPTGKTESYHRIHAVFFDGNALVSVLYTARELDRESFDIAIDNVRRGA